MKEKILKAGEIVLKHTSPLAYDIYTNVTASGNAVGEASGKDLETFKKEVEKRTIELGFAKQQALIEQELAIARRIDNAEEVEIEEFYDLSGSGKAGVGINSSEGVTSVSAGISGEGKKVSRRIYRFKSKTSAIVIQSEEENSE